MSNSFYVRCQDYLDLEAIQQLVQRHFGQEMELCLNRGDRDYGGLFYIKGQSTCGVEVCKEDDDLVVRLPLLADYADFFLAKLFLDIFHQFLGEDVRQEDGQVVEVRDYFSDETIQQLRDQDSRIFGLMLKDAAHDITISGAVRQVCFGRQEAEYFSQCQLDPTELTQRLTSFIGGMQWGDSEVAPEGE